jgi:hypothetical protein
VSVSADFWCCLQLDASLPRRVKGNQQLAFNRSVSGLVAKPDEVRDMLIQSTDQH